jgi:hypothetical protein
LPGWTPLVFTPAGAPYPTAPYPTPPASRTPRAFDPNDPAAFATDLALQIDAAEQALVDLIKVLARLADGPQPGTPWTPTSCRRNSRRTGNTETAMREIATLPERTRGRDGGGLRGGWEADVMSKPAPAQLGISVRSGRWWWT